MAEQEICPQCPRGCSSDDLSCGRGKAYFAQKEGASMNPEDVKQTAAPEEKGHKHDKGGHHGHHKHGGHKPDMDSLYGLMRACGHYLHHAGHDVDQSTVFSALSSEEQDQLKTLLTKLVTGWKDNKEEQS